MLFEETRKALFCPDLFRHFGKCEPARKAMRQMQQGPLPDYVPSTSQTEGVLRGLAELKPEMLAVMHGSSYRRPCDRLLTDLAGVIKDEFDKP